jgi:hypothetical protein
MSDERNQGEALHSIHAAESTRRSTACMPAKANTCNHQAASSSNSSNYLLNALPLEVRQEIWCAVLGGGNVYHLSLGGANSLRYKECSFPPRTYCKGAGPCATTHLHTKKRLALLLTCQQM